jgi:hypothetical protein
MPLEQADDAVWREDLGVTLYSADLVRFLASERARYITGTAVNIDGEVSAAV